MTDGIQFHEHLPVNLTGLLLIGNRLHQSTDSYLIGPGRCRGQSITDPALRFLFRAAVLGLNMLRARTMLYTQRRVFRFLQGLRNDIPTGPSIGQYSTERLLTTDRSICY